MRIPVITAVITKIKNWIGHLRPYNGISTPIILQQSDTECGIAALAIIFAYHQFNISLEALRDFCGGGSRDGSKAITLMHMANHYGFVAQAFKMELNAIALLVEPVIAFWNFNHYVVINGVGTGKVFLNDPAFGPRTVSTELFDQAFTGVVIRVIPTENIIKIPKRNLYTVIWKEWVRPFHLEICYLLGCFLFLLCWPFFNTTLTTLLVDQCIINGHMQWIAPIAMIYSMGAIIYLGTKMSCKWHEFKLNTHASLKKSLQIMGHVLQMPLLYFSLRQKSEIIATLAKIEFAIHSMYQALNQFVVNALLALLVLSFLFVINAKLCAMTCALSLLSCGITFFLSYLSLCYEKTNIHVLGKWYAHSLSWIKNIETIKASGLENKILNRWHSFFCKKLNVHAQISQLNLIANLMQKISQMCAGLLMLYMGGSGVISGINSIGALFSFFSLQLIFNASINSVFQALKNSMGALAIHSRVMEIKSNDIDVRFNKPSHPTIILENARTNLEQVIIATELQFFYNKTLNPNINITHLRIHKGEHIGIVGESGSGKSTLAKLLCGLYHANTGELLLYGQPIQHYGADQLTHLIAYVSQDVMLMAGSIYENLMFGAHAGHTAYANPSSLINHALHVTCLTELIHRRGLYAKVEEQGNNFSGGEKQRIDIARALIQNTPILILDEATAALDVYTEQRILCNLKKENRTIISIAHRSSAIADCDRVIVLEKGKIKQIINH